MYSILVKEYPCLLPENGDQEQDTCLLPEDGDQEQDPPPSRGG